MYIFFILHYLIKTTIIIIYISIFKVLSYILVFVLKFNKKTNIVYIYI